MKSWRSNSSEARLRTIHVKQEHARPVKNIFGLVHDFSSGQITRGKKMKKTPETMSAMSDFEMEGPKESKTQVACN